MKYLLLIYLDEKGFSQFSESQRAQMMRDGIEFAGDLKATGKLLGCAPLDSVVTAKSVRVRDGKRLVTDGPFAETREQLGGYYLIDVADRAEAIDVVARMPGGGPWTMEIRPVFELAGLPVA
jgi:hypothetical protein